MMSATHQAYTIESPLSPKGAQGSVNSFQNSSSEKSFDKTDDCKFDGSINGNLVLFESLNTSGDLSTQPASRSSCASPELAKSNTKSAGNVQNMVMIDQQQLLDLMQAKKILDSQQQQQNTAESNTDFLTAATQ